MIERDVDACAERYATQVKETMPVLMTKIKEIQEQKREEEAEISRLRKTGRVVERRPNWNETNTESQKVGKDGHFALPGSKMVFNKRDPSTDKLNNTRSKSRTKNSRPTKRAVSRHF